MMAELCNCAEVCPREAALVRRLKDVADIMTEVFRGETPLNAKLCAIAHSLSHCTTKL